MDPISKAIASDQNRNLELLDDPTADAGNPEGDKNANQPVSPTSTERRVPLAPEIVVPELEKVEKWDEAATGGSRVEPILPEDEASLGEELVLEGADDADVDLRNSTEKEEEEEEI